MSEALAICQWTSLQSPGPWEMQARSSGVKWSAKKCQWSRFMVLHVCPVFGRPTQTYLDFQSWSGPTWTGTKLWTCLLSFPLVSMTKATVYLNCGCRIQNPFLLGDWVSKQRGFLLIDWAFWTWKAILSLNRVMCTSFTIKTVSITVPKLLGCDSSRKVSSLIMDSSSIHHPHGSLLWYALALCILIYIYIYIYGCSLWCILTYFPGCLNLF